MAPTKQRLVPLVTSRPPINTRSKVVTLRVKDVGNKRKAESSPAQETKVKRSALGELTNYVTNKIELKSKAAAKQALTVKSDITKKIVTVAGSKVDNTENTAPLAPGLKVKSRPTTRNYVANETAIKPKEAPVQKDTTSSKVKTRLSNEFEKTDESIYSTPAEQMSLLDKSTNPSNVSLIATQLEENLNLGCHDVPKNVSDFDKENWDDIYQVSHYAMDIFNYLKDRESLADIPNYMDRQVCLTKWMRSLLVDWMVEIQESFELNHETLYLGVKLVDLYLSRMTVGKETLQLVGAAAMFVASKYDERTPPMIDDFLYICDGAYTRDEVIRMEMNLLKVCNFDLGISISYRFLRRYARCAKVGMSVLTLARFILESSLLNYDTVPIRDSKLAAASLYLALKMKKIGSWTPTLEFYTGYKLNEIMDVVLILNKDLHNKPKSQLMTIRNKYSHKIFFEVAKTPLIDSQDLRG